MAQERISGEGEGLAPLSELKLVIKKMATPGAVSISCVLPRPPSDNPVAFPPPSPLALVWHLRGGGGVDMKYKVHTCGWARCLNDLHTVG